MNDTTQVQGDAAQASSEAQPSPCVSPLDGLKILLMGDSGTGKTAAIHTLKKAGIFPFICFTEPGVDTLMDWAKPCEDFHWMYVPPSNAPLLVQLARAKQINQLSWGALKKIDDPNKNKYSQFLTLIEAHNNFICRGCGKEFGDVMTWNTDRAIIDDSLSGISTMSMQLTVGGKASPHEGEWGTAMSNIEMYVNSLTNGTHCHYILMAHLAREIDEVVGSNIYASTLGKKLAPKLPYNFTDVVNAKRVGTTFTWSTTEPDMALKARNLVWGRDIDPSFEPLIKKWQDKGGIICSTEESKTS